MAIHALSIAPLASYHIHAVWNSFLFYFHFYSRFAIAVLWINKNCCRIDEAEVTILALNWKIATCMCPFVLELDGWLVRSNISFKIREKFILQLQWKLNLKFIAISICSTVQNQTHHWCKGISDRLSLQSKQRIINILNVQSSYQLIDSWILLNILVSQLIDFVFFFMQCNEIQQCIKWFDIVGIAMHTIQLKEVDEHLVSAHFTQSNNYPLYDCYESTIRISNNNNNMKVLFLRFNKNLIDALFFVNAFISCHSNTFT